MELQDIWLIWQQQQVIVLLLLGMLSVLLWRVPFVGVLFYPFRLFYTFVHEIGHGIAALLTGGRFHRFTVHASRIGIAQTSGGARVIILSGGYLVPALFGGVLVLLSNASTIVAPRNVLISLGVLLLLICVCFVRNMFGVAAGVLLAAAFACAGVYLDDTLARYLLLLLAVQMMLSALDSLVDLVRMSSRRHLRDLPTDAWQMATITGVPAVVWAVLWSKIGAAILLVSITVAYSGGALG